jgi:hypothetical protein
MLAGMAGLIEREDLLLEYREEWTGKAKPPLVEVWGDGGPCWAKAARESHRESGDMAGRHVQACTHALPP